MKLVNAIVESHFSESDDHTPLFVLTTFGSPVVQLDRSEVSRLRARWKVLVVVWLIGVAPMVAMACLASNLPHHQFQQAAALLWLYGRWWMPFLLVIGRRVRRASNPQAHVARGKVAGALGRSRVNALIWTCAGLGSIFMLWWISTEPWGPGDPKAWLKTSSLSALSGWVLFWLVALWLSFDLFEIREPEAGQQRRRE